MDREAAERIDAAAERDPESATALSGLSGFDERAADAAARNEPDCDEDY
ncbi:hypothetical protein GCM10009680_56550 [Streptomyces yatensis]|uniref:Uncharacterized protein n=1 Tax=Streptomyces yatensis TaxID=155177 RepID=A0ABN2INV2_9ACTN